MSGAPGRDVGNGVAVWSTPVTSTSQLADGSSVEMTVQYDELLKRLVCDSLTVKRPGPGHDVTGESLRDIAVRSALVSDAALTWSCWLRGPDGSWGLAAEVLARMEPMKGRDRASVLKDAAQVYTFARVINIPPLKTVAEVLEVSHSTAKRLVGEARSSGVDL